MAETSLLKDISTNIVNASDNLPGYVFNAGSITLFPSSSMNESKSSLMTDLNQPISKATGDVKENTSDECDYPKEVEDNLYLKINENYDNNGSNSALSPKNCHSHEKRSISWKKDLTEANEYNPKHFAWLNNKDPDEIANRAYINCDFPCSEDSSLQQKILAITEEDAVSLSTENKYIVAEKTKENQPEFLNIAMFKRTISQSPLNGGSRQNNWKDLVSKKRYYTKKLKTHRQLMNDKIEKSRKKQEKLKLTIEQVTHTIRLKKEETVDLKLVEKDEWEKYLVGHKEIRELKQCYDKSKVVILQSLWTIREKLDKALQLFKDQLCDVQRNLKQKWRLFGKRNLEIEKQEIQWNLDYLEKVIVDINKEIYVFLMYKLTGEENSVTV